jgi:hypothetical protein
MNSGECKNSRYATRDNAVWKANSWYGFRYAFYSLADLGWIGPGQTKFVSDKTFYSGFGLGLRVRNEHLVLPTLQMRLAWFPRVPESASASTFLYNERAEANIRRIPGNCSRSCCLIDKT